LIKNTGSIYVPEVKEMPRTMLNAMVHALHQAGDHDGYMMDQNWMGGMWFWMFAIWLVLVLVAVLVYRDARARSMNAPSGFF